MFHLDPYRIFQIQGADHSIYSTFRYTNYQGVWDCIRTMYAKEGTLAFFKGLSPTLWKMVPASAVSFLVFEKTKEILISRRS